MVKGLIKLSIFLAITSVMLVFSWTFASNTWAQGDEPVNNRELLKEDSCDANSFYIVLNKDGISIETGKLDGKNFKDNQFACSPEDTEGSCSVFINGTMITVSHKIFEELSEDQEYTYVLVDLDGDSIEIDEDSQSQLDEWQKEIDTLEEKCATDCTDEESSKLEELNTKADELRTEVQQKASQETQQLINGFLGWLVDNEILTGLTAEEISSISESVMLGNCGSEKILAYNASSNSWVTFNNFVEESTDNQKDEDTKEASFDNTDDSNEPSESSQNSVTASQKDDSWKQKWLGVIVVVVTILMFGAVSYIVIGIKRKEDE